MLSLEPFKGYVTTPGYAMHSEITEILPVSTDAWMYSFFNRNMTNSRDMMMKNIYLIVFKEIYIINCSMFLECSFFLLVSIPLPSISIDQLLQLFPILILLASIIRKKKKIGASFVNPIWHSVRTWSRSYHLLNFAQTCFLHTE